jgi:hypothetical protein
LAPPHPVHLEAGSISLPTSPCSESSTLQRTLLLKNSRTGILTVWLCGLNQLHQIHNVPIQQVQTCRKN